MTYTFWFTYFSSAMLELLVMGTIPLHLLDSSIVFFFYAIGSMSHILIIALYAVFYTARWKMIDEHPIPQENQTTAS